MFKPLNELKHNTRKHGLKYALKELFKKYGWKVGVALFFYYLIRDVSRFDARIIFKSLNKKQRLRLTKTSLICLLHNPKLCFLQYY